MLRFAALALSLAVCACRPAAVASPGSSAKLAPPQRSSVPAPPPGDSEVPRLDTRPLFHRVGGMAAIETVVEEWFARASRDPRVRERFHGLDTTELQRAVAQIACGATGGPCARDAAALRAATAGLELVGAELDALGQDLSAVLHELGMREREHRELLGTLARLRPQLLAAPDTLRPIAPERLAVVTMLANALPRFEVEARALLHAAALAGGRGQRTYAEQLFTRAEALVRPERLMAAAEIFRASAPVRVVEARRDQGTVMVPVSSTSAMSK